LSSRRVERIDSLHDPRVASYRNVKDARLRGDAGLFLAEGRLGVQRLIAGKRFRAHSVFVTDTVLRAMGEVFDGLGVDTPVYVTDQVLMNQVVGFAMHRGCLAAAEREPVPEFEALLRRNSAAPRLFVILDEVSNPENIGSVFRNALAFGAEGVLLSPGCADPLYRKAIRVSMGASMVVPYALLPDWSRAADALHADGFTIAALSTAADARDIREFSAAGGNDRDLALLLGSEGEGVRAFVADSADLRLRIPMAAGIDSLNVATAAGIALHQCARLPQREDNGGGDP